MEIPYKGNPLRGNPLQGEILDRPDKTRLELGQAEAGTGLNMGETKMKALKLVEIM